MAKKEIEFRMTCDACPEQYDVFDEDGNEIAYVRLRWGSLYCECPFGGETVFEASFDNGYKGSFASEEERRLYLEEIRDAITCYYGWE